MSKNDNVVSWTHFHDVAWEKTSLGPFESWPNHQRVLTELCLNSQTPMALWLGDEFRLIHNELFCRWLDPAEKPWKMGLPVRQMSKAVNESLEPEIREVVSQKETIRREGVTSPSAPQNHDFIYSYSLTPVEGPDGNLLAVVQTVEEHTRYVRDRNQMSDFLSFTLTNSHMGTWELVQGETNVRRTPQHDQIFGYKETLKEWNLQKFLEHLLPEDRPDMERRFAEASVTGAQWQFEHRFRRVDGEIRWAWSAGRHIPAHNGTPAKMMGVIQEITERKRAEEALKASEELFRTVVETSPDGICMQDANTGRFLLLSPAGVQARGFTLEEMNQMSVQEALERIHPEDRKRAMQQQEELVRGAPVSRVEYRWRVKSRAYRWFQDNRRLVRDSHGKPLAFVAVIRDITERRKVDAALEQSRAFLEHERVRLQAILDTIPVGLYVTDSQGGILRTNAAVERIWRGGNRPRSIEEYSEYSGIWTDTGKPVAPDEWPAARALIQGKKTEGMIIDIERFDGTKGTIVASGAPIINEHNQVTGSVVVVQDISELRDAQRRLEEAHKRKNEFLAVLSHELRNPLTPIRNSLHILSRAAAGSTAFLKAQEVIDRQVEHLSSLIDDLLDVTRITSGKVKLHEQELELNQLVKNTMEDYRSLFQKAHVDVTLKLPQEPIYIRGDTLRVAQVFSNLLHNATKFTPASGQVHVTVATQGNDAVLTVADTGSGMSPEVIGNLFQPFMQADTTLDRSKGGLGLGLALVKGLVELHGGTVSAYSEGPGKGSTFVVRFPCIQLSKQKAPSSPQQTSMFRKVLIIEDHQDLAESFKELLELDGHEVKTAASGPEGLEVARKFQPDIVFCDIGLPGMDGYQVAKAFRQDEALRDIRLVALSGYALPDDVRRAQEAGFSDHVSKPPKLERLYELLQSAPHGSA